MITFRRYTIYLCIAILLILTFTNFHKKLSSSIHYSSSRPFPGTPIKHADGRFHWEDVPVDYPVTSLIPLPTAKPLKLPKIQFDFPAETAEQAAVRKERRDAVKATFEKTWNAYKKYAWMHDEVTPLSGGYKDGFGGWAGMFGRSFGRNITHAS